MKVTLAELMPIKRMLEDRLGTIRSNIHNNKYFLDVKRKVVEERDLSEELQNFESLLKEYENLSEKIRKIDLLINEKNLETYIDTEFGSLKLREALLKAKEIRSIAQIYSSLSNEVEIEMVSGVSSQIYYQRTLYDPKKYAKKAKELLLQARKISSAIELTNNTVVLDVDFLKEYLE